MTTWFLWRPRLRDPDDEAEKVAALCTARYFEERASRAKPGVFDRLMKTAGAEPPRPGDEVLPASTEGAGP